MTRVQEFVTYEEPEKHWTNTDSNDNRDSLYVDRLKPPIEANISFVNRETSNTN